MAITKIGNQAVTFNAFGDPSFNDNDGKCNEHHDYFNPVECADQTNFEVNVSPVTGLDLVEDGAFTVVSKDGFTTANVANSVEDTTESQFVVGDVGNRILNGVTLAEANVTSFINADTLGLDADIFTAFPESYNMSSWFLTGNPGFSSTGWSTDGTQALGQGSGVGTQEMFQDILTVGRFYRVQFTLKLISSISTDKKFKVYFGDTANSPVETLDIDSELRTYTVFGFCETDVNLIFQVEEVVTVQISDVSAFEFSQLGYNVIDADDESVVFTDITNTTIDYSNLTDTALVSFDWSNLVCADGCFKFNIFDLSTNDIEVGTTFFNDTFTDTNGTLIQNHTPDIGTSWGFISVDDTATIQSNILQFNLVGLSSDGTATANGTFSSPNQSLTFTTSNFSSGTQTTEVSLRGDGLTGQLVNNAYILRFVAGFLSINKSDSVGAITLIANIAGSYAASNVFTFAIIGDTIIIKKDGITIHRGEDSANQQAGQPRIRWIGGPGNTDRFDDFLVQEAAFASSLISEPFNLAVDHACTLLLSATNNDNAFGLDFEGLTFQQFLRVRACIGKPNYGNGDLETLINSFGVDNIVYAQTRKNREMTVNAVPEYIHDAIDKFRLHDTFSIEAIEYTPTEIDYVPEWRDTDDLAPSIMTISIKSQNNVNTNCQ